MRKISLILLITALLAIWALPALGEEQASVHLEINGERVLPEAPPFILDGFTMVPLRFISESCGLKVDWDGHLRRVTVFGGEYTLRLDIGSATAYINGEPAQLQAPPLISNGYTMVPLRFIMESLQARVEWEPATRTVKIFTGYPDTAQTANPPQDAPVASKAGRVTGYYFDSASWDMLTAYCGTFNTVINFAYKVFADGSVASKNYNSGWEENALPFLKAERMESLILVTDFGDPPANKQEGSASMLANAATRANGVANIAELVRQTGVDGVDIDFENMDTASRDNFTAFIRELKAALPDKLVTVSVKPCRSERETWLNMFDYKALGLAADRVHVMFYDQHYGGSEPGPVASPQWIRQGLDHMLTLIPKEKLHVMLGAYGRAWGGAYRGSSVHISRAREIIEEFSAEVKRDEASGVPYLLYKDKDGSPMQLWFEDPVSLGQKAALAREYGVGGIGLWRMGIVPDDVWESVIDNYLK
ncbi:MAG: stalk domain-containing protein [Clostridiales bacterium]|nr:stalk domain-containing protein [Clostridiales bacterium]